VNPAVRAPALPAEERRSSLITAFLDEVRESGSVPTTRRIAARAGVAEGTIFRVFDTKDDLQREAVETAFCPAGWRSAVESIPAGLGLEATFVALARVIQERFLATFELMR